MDEGIITNKAIQVTINVYKDEDYVVYVRNVNDYVMANLSVQDENVKIYLKNGFSNL